MCLLYLSMFETFVNEHHLQSCPLSGIIGSLRNHNGDAEDNVDWKMYLYFTYESRGTLKSCILSTTVKAITKLNLEHIDKFEIKF